MRFSKGCIVFIFLFLGACSNPDRSPYFIPIISDMMESVPHDTYAPSKLHHDGKTLQAPEPGTVFTAYSPHLWGQAKEDVEQAAKLKNPIPVSDNVLARGKQVYESKCQVCHGPRGFADGPIIGKFPNPPRFNSQRVKILTEGNIFHSITVGKGLMSPYGPMIQTKDRWKLIHYVKYLIKDLEDNPPKEVEKQDEAKDKEQETL